MQKFNICKTKNLLSAFCLLFTLISYPFHTKASTAGWSLDKDIKGSLNIDGVKQLKKLKKVVVAVIDTGIDPLHPNLKHKIVSYDNDNGNFTPATIYDFGRDFSPGSLSFKRPHDENGHGTHIASIITKVAPNAKILPIKYYNKDATEKENLNATIDAIKYAINAGVKIINYSSGGSGKSAIESEVIDFANKNGVLLIAAAGNFGENIDHKGLKYYPASYGHKNIISVINHGPNYILHKTSNYGKLNADLSAPGTNILGAIPNQRFGSLTGTSQSTAFVSATAVLIRGINKNINHLKIKEFIIKSADKVDSLKNKCLSSGALNLSRSLKFAESYAQRNYASTSASGNIKNSL